MTDATESKEQERRLSIRQALIDWSAVVPVLVKLVEWLMQNV
ncbi:hypothetical protein ACE1OC_43350 (plasmid) [Streptomyces sp. DSM 116496]